jgi:hypothetical protein
MRSLFKFGAAALATVGIATGVYAAQHYNTGFGTDRNYFWTIFAKGTEYAGVNVLNNTGKATFSWKTNVGAGNDFAAFSTVSLHGISTQPATMLFLVRMVGPATIRANWMLNFT